MATDKVTITIDRELLNRLDRLVAEKLFPSRSQAIQEAIEEKLSRLEHSQLAREICQIRPAIRTKIC